MAQIALWKMAVNWNVVREEPFSWTNKMGCPCGWMCRYSCSVTQGQGGHGALPMVMWWLTPSWSVFDKRIVIPKPSLMCKALPEVSVQEPETNFPTLSAPKNVIRNSVLNFTASNLGEHIEGRIPTICWSMASDTGNHVSERFPAVSMPPPPFLLWNHCMDPAGQGPEPRNKWQPDSYSLWRQTTTIHVDIVSQDWPSHPILKRDGCSCSCSILSLPRPGSNWAAQTIWHNKALPFRLPSWPPMDQWACAIFKPSPANPRPAIGTGAPKPFLPVNRSKVLTLQWRDQCQNHYLNHKEYLFVPLHTTIKGE